MPRVVLKPLDDYLFTWQMPIRTTDMNYANHLSACALVGMLDEAYTRFLESLGLGEMGFGEHIVNQHEMHTSCFRHRTKRACEVLV